MGRCENAPTVCVGKNYIDNAKTEEVLEAIIDRFPPPREGKEVSRGLIFDSFYDHGLFSGN